MLIEFRSFSSLHLSKPVCLPKESSCTELIQVFLCQFTITTNHYNINNINSMREKVSMSHFNSKNVQTSIDKLINFVYAIFATLK